MHWSKPKSFTVGLICTTALIGSALSVSSSLSIMLFSAKPAFGKIVLGSPISRKANYLAALGLSAYTEILGGLYCGDLHKHTDKFFHALHEN
jgi:hypothetical protein